MEVVRYLGLHSVGMVVVEAVIASLVRGPPRHQLQQEEEEEEGMDGVLIMITDYLEVEREVYSLDMLDQLLQTLVLQPPTTAAARMVELVQLVARVEAVCESLTARLKAGRDGRSGVSQPARPGRGRRDRGSAGGRGGGPGLAAQI